MVMQGRTATGWMGALIVCATLALASAARAEFGFPPGNGGFSVSVTNADGTPDLQAGSHPFAMTTSFFLKRTTNSNGETVPDQNMKDVAVELPPGLVGNANAVPQCSQQLLITVPEKSNVFDQSSCPPSTAVGVERVGWVLGEGGEEGSYYVNIYNLVPPPSTPAEFGFNVLGIPVVLKPSVRTGRDYGLTVESHNTSEGTRIYSATTTFWGVPADHRHDGERGRRCLAPLGGSQGNLCPANTAVVPLLTLPTSCTGPLSFGIRGDSWQSPREPGEQARSSYRLQDAEGNPVGLDGCHELPFEPALQMVPNGTAGSTPTGLDVNLNIPREADNNPEGLSEADVKSTTVTLPEGVVLNPSASDGLQACSEEQAGFEGVDPRTETDDFSPGPVSCPEAAKVGLVKVKTPLLPEDLEGAVYLAAQEANPFNSLVALYLTAENATEGVRVKLAGEVKLNPETGRLEATFLNTPPLPFEAFKLEFFGTDRAPLGTPALCGTYSSEASIAPWSGNPAANPLTQFNILTGPNGGACANPLPFAPSLTAGSTNIQAGGLSPFTMTMSRNDGQQTLSTIQLHMPPGLMAMLSSVKLCGEPQAQEGRCGPESLIGHTVVSVGLGNDPFSVTGGQVYITGPYKGAPYGLSIVNPAKAGPFDLENHAACDCLVVRAKIEVDPHTAAITVVSDPLPTILQGIPLQIRHVYVAVDRPGFTFNPTNCHRLSITGGLSSTQGASAALAVPFQVTNCAVLAFKPTFKVSTSGHTSRANGASLNVKLSFPNWSQGSQANIAKVKVDLPRQLPSRLTTLQKACTAATFEANPANCPATSIVGHAKVVTPLLPVPLTGPAYFVSHGGEAFPSLIIVLQGYGVTVELVGSTFINRAGVTSSTFRSTPDVPFNTFELNLPEGPYSALGANANLCKSKLRMPTAFVAQNGAVIHQSTKVTVTSCRKHRVRSSRRHRKHGHHGKQIRGSKKG
jgi:hypothetical protein